MYVFIGGTPTAGKTYSAKKFIQQSGKDIFLLSLDELRKNFNDPELKYWVDFFFNQDEAEYWKNTTYSQAIQNLIKQSEAFWPQILEVINQTKKIHKNAIFEAVNILPHLAYKYLDFPGFFLVCDDYKIVLERNMKAPRWGGTKKLQELEAKYFIEYDVKFIKEEARKYNYKVLNDEKEAIQELTKLFE